jgi:hypothetical protein
VERVWLTGLWRAARHLSKCQLRTAVRYSNPCALRPSCAYVRTRTELHGRTASRIVPVATDQKAGVRFPPSTPGRRLLLNPGWGAILGAAGYGSRTEQHLTQYFAASKLGVLQPGMK